MPSVRLGLYYGTNKYICFLIEVLAADETFSVKEMPLSHLKFDLESKNFGNPPVQPSEPMQDEFMSCLQWAKPRYAGIDRNFFFKEKQIYALPCLVT